MAAWAKPTARCWTTARERLKAADLSVEQVQIAWVKLANKQPSGSMDEHLNQLEADTLKVLQNAQKAFPNLKLVFLASRTWAGEGKTTLNPEPYAYESAFAVRNLIQRQKEADNTPLLLWGPYLWSEGGHGRKTDDLVWLREDFVQDGIHPSQSGRLKVANLLLDFCQTNALATPWFTGSEK